MKQKQTATRYSLVVKTCRSICKPEFRMSSTVYGKAQNRKTWIGFLNWNLCKRFTAGIIGNFCLCDRQSMWSWWLNDFIQMLLEFSKNKSTMMAQRYFLMLLKNVIAEHLVMMQTGAKKKSCIRKFRYGWSPLFRYLDFFFVGDDNFLA